jgi:hypothetical protein
MVPGQPSEQRAKPSRSARSRLSPWHWCAPTAVARWSRRPSAEWSAARVGESGELGTARAGVFQMVPTALATRAPVASSSAWEATSLAWLRRSRPAVVRGCPAICRCEDGLRHRSPGRWACYAQGCRPAPVPATWPIFVHSVRRKLLDNPWQNTPQAADLGLHHGAGDENRTRTLSLGSDGAWARSMALTCADGVRMGSREGRTTPLPTVVDRSEGHAVGTAPLSSLASGSGGACTSRSPPSPGRIGSLGRGCTCRRGLPDAADGSRETCPRGGRRRGRPGPCSVVSQRPA